MDIKQRLQSQVRKKCHITNLFQAEARRENRGDQIFTKTTDARTQDRINYFAERIPTCRLLVNSPSSQGGIGDLYNFKLEPSLTLGCGSWGGNSVSGNVGVENLLNYKTLYFLIVYKRKYRLSVTAVNDIFFHGNN